jgi:methionine sulfoxide reductase heme-binding subunit
MFGMKNKSFKVVLVLFVIIFAGLLHVYAQDAVAKDTDLDGVSDDAEINIYHTNPNSPDTDKDGIMDYQEILNKTNPNDPNSNILVTANPKVYTNLPIIWYIGRVAGISAFMMFTFVVCMGLLMTSKFLLKFRVMFPATALETHRFNATYIAFTLVLIHVVSFIFDGVLKLTPYEALVPFLMHRDIKSALGYDLTIPMSLGIIALYISIILIITSNFRNKIISTKNWRIVHYLSFVFYILFIVHGFLSGTDSKQWWMLAIYGSSLGLVIILILMRIFRKDLFMPKRMVPVVPPENELINPNPPVAPRLRSVDKSE